jgi:NACalpha-BTF3-like transcription factor
MAHSTLFCIATEKKGTSVGSGDITVVVDECDVSKEKAEELLRQHGSLKAALKYYIKGGVV